MKGKVGLKVRKKERKIGNKKKTKGTEGQTGKAK